MRRLRPPDLALSRAVDEVLHYLWDPIGVASFPEARDEYHGYLPHIFGMLKGGSIEDQHADYLGVVSTERMGLSPRYGPTCDAGRSGRRCEVQGEVRSRLVPKPSRFF